MADSNSCNVPWKAHTPCASRKQLKHTPKINRFNRMKIWNIRNISRHKLFSIAYWSSLQNHIASREEWYWWDQGAHWQLENAEPFYIENFSRVMLLLLLLYFPWTNNRVENEKTYSSYVQFFSFSSVLCFSSTGAFRFSFALFSQSIYKWNSKDAEYNTGANRSIDMIMHNNP